MSAKLLATLRTEQQDDQPSAVSREAASWRATYSYSANGFRYTDEALVRDVSRSGCSIRGRNGLAVGRKTTVTFYLLDRPRPISVIAKVLWVTGECFGVEFLNLNNDAYQRIQQSMENGLISSHAGTLEMPLIRRERRQANLGLAVSLLVLGALCGCGTLAPSGPAASTPFFTPTAEERVNLALEAAELDAIALKCIADNSCNERVHFSRALVSLFENRDAARASFEKVISLNPTSPLANCSTLWLQLLNEEAPALTAPYRPLLGGLTSQWLRQWMATRPASSSSQEPTLGVAKPALVRALHQQVRERDRHIAHLRAQLDALKVINQDQEERRTMRPPTSFFPKLERGR